MPVGGRQGAGAVVQAGTPVDPHQQDGQQAQQLEVEAADVLHPPQLLHPRHCHTSWSLGLRGCDDGRDMALHRRCFIFAAARLHRLRPAL